MNESDPTRREGDAAGAVFLLMPPRPNPASGFVTIPFVPDRDGMVRLDICDMYGAVVRSFSFNAVTDRENAIYWDLRDERGTPVPNGVYGCKLSGANAMRSERIVVLR